MIDLGKKNIGGILINAIDYDAAVARTVQAARHKEPFAVSALAAHGTMTGAADSEHRFRLNSFNLLVPDGQPVRWALNLLHKTSLTDRVYGPNLTLRLLAAAEENKLPVYFYGTSPEILGKLRESLAMLYPSLQIAGMEASRFRQLTPDESFDVIGRIDASGARMLFVGLGCPRQEIFAFEFRSLLSMPIIAVGAAFPFIAGTLQQAPPWMQQRGLEWLFRLIQEPRRLWRRYFVTNSQFVFTIARQLLGKKFSTVGDRPSSAFLFG
jgi:N-acetylglucosaminyldiphosphoundecaprenol N-acetyl-beta-D-mannosaminyltransferase